MFPKTLSGRKKYLQYTRELEASLTLKALSGFLRDVPSFKDREINIFEFGTGDAFQIPYLLQIGNVIASDIYASRNILKKEFDFVECSVTNAPFVDGQFDLIVSNHVIEHIPDVNRALNELKRIGQVDTIYAFSVPTNIWLLISIPAQYYNKFRAVVRKLLAIIPTGNIGKHNNTSNKYLRRAKYERREGQLIKRWHYIFPNGHGVYPGFIECYGAFRIKRWQQLFSDNGFELVKTQPLLLYGPPEWPIMPITQFFNRVNFCSSVLFLLKKRVSK